MASLRYMDVYEMVLKHWKACGWDTRTLMVKSESQIWAMYFLYQRTGWKVPTKSKQIKGQISLEELA